MLLKYNDGETTFILQTTSIDLNEIDYLNDINRGDHRTVAYMKDGQTTHTLRIVAEEPSTEEPHLEEL
jgi:hypothetical protein